MNRCPQLASCAGTCLAEVLIALAAGAVVLAATVQALAHFDRRLTEQMTVMSRAQELRVGLKVLEEELRLATAIEGQPILSVSPDGQTVEFWANLDGLATTLTNDVAPGQREIRVTDGREWPSGKTIALCHGVDCEAARLARDGRRASMALTTPVGRFWQSGTQVSMRNRVRYYLKRETRGRVTLMRQVDGGANPLIGEIERFRVHIAANSKGAQSVPPSTLHVRIEIAVTGQSIPLVREMGVLTGL